MKESNKEKQYVNLDISARMHYNIHVFAKGVLGVMGLFPVIREKKRLKPQPSIAQALDFRR